MRIINKLIRSHIQQLRYENSRLNAELEVKDQVGKALGYYTEGYYRV